MPSRPQPKPRWKDVSFGLRKIQHAYLTGNYVAASRRYGMFIHTPDGPDLVAVAVVAIPAQARVLTNVFSELRPYAESLELARFVLEGQRLRVAGAIGTGGSRTGQLGKCAMLHAMQQFVGCPLLGSRVPVRD
jgi:hypothetical protein